MNLFCAPALSLYTCLISHSEPSSMQLLIQIVQAPCDFSSEAAIEQYCQQLKEKSIPLLLACPSMKVQLAAQKKKVEDP